MTGQVVSSVTKQDTYLFVIKGSLTGLLIIWPCDPALKGWAIVTNKIIRSFDAAALRANILDSQRHGQKYREFTRRAMAGGVQGYIAFLRGKRVTYWGRTGDQHTEWFPGSVPDWPPLAKAP